MPASQWLSGGPKVEGTSIRMTGSPATLDFIRRGSKRHSQMVERIARRHAREATEEATRALRDETRSLTPRRSGRSRTKIVDRVVAAGGGDYIGTVSSDDKTVKILVQGSGVHGPKKRPIMARNGQAMRFPNRAGGGFRLNQDVPRVRGGQPHPAIAYIYAKKIEGQEGHDMFRKAVPLARPKIGRIYGRHSRLAAAEIRALLR